MNTIYIIVFFILCALFMTMKYLNRINEVYNKICISLNKCRANLCSLDELDKNNLSEIEDVFARYDVLKSSWKAYSRNIIVKNLDEDGTTVLRSSEAPDKYFSRERLVKRTLKNYDLIKTIPGLLTAWGLLGTFIAILLGLQGVDPNNIDTINNLIEGLSGKFMSSICALLCSILFIIVERVKYDKLKVCCSEMQSCLLDFFPVMQEKQLLFEMNQKIELQTTVMKGWCANISQNSQESMKEMIEMFQKSLTDNTVDKFDQMVSSLDYILRTIEKMENAQNDYVERLNEINNIAQKSLSKQQKSFEKIDVLFDNFRSTIEDVESLMNNEAAQLETIKKLTENLQDTNENLGKLVPNLDNSIGAIGTLKDSIASSIDLYKQVTEHFSAEKFEEILKRYEEGINTTLMAIRADLLEDSQIIKDNCSYYEDQLSNLVETSHTTIDKIHESMGKYAEVTKEFLAQYDKSIAKAVGYLNTNINSMNDSLNNSVQQVDGNLQEFNSVIKKQLALIKKGQVNE